MKLTWVREGHRLTRTVELLPETRKNDNKQDVTVYPFGAGADERAVSRSPAELLPYSMGFAEAASKAAFETADWIRKMGLVVGGLFAGRISTKTIGGPGMLIDIAVQAAEAGRDTYLQTMAIISVNLGFINLIPIPVLDGFHVFTALGELLRDILVALRLLPRQYRGRPLPTRLREVATYIGLGLLATVMIFIALRNDFVTYILGE